MTRRFFVLGILGLAIPVVRADSRFSGGNPSALAFARQVIASKLRLLRAGDVKTLRLTFLTEARKRITPARVAAASKRLASTTATDLVDSVVEIRGDLKLLRKDGSVLVILHEADGMWYADRVWF